MQGLSFPAYRTRPSFIQQAHKQITGFAGAFTKNVDKKVVDSFGQEWKKFHEFSEDDINKLAAEYFDIIPEHLYSTSTRVLDVGCGSGRWTKVLSQRVGMVDAVDPSDAIYAADELLKSSANIRLTQATTEALPFEDNTYDLVVSIGVLHHIPDTQQAMKDCVSKVKPGGYFYTYLYYNLENRGPVFKSVFRLSDILRRAVSGLPAGLKKFSCDLLALFVYMPFVLISRLLFGLGFQNAADSIPLSTYKNKSFFIIRNDALDRFGTKLEHRFSRQQVHDMLTACGLTDITFSDKAPYWHAIAKKP